MFGNRDEAGRSRGHAPAESRRVLAGDFGESRLASLSLLPSTPTSSASLGPACTHRHAWYWRTTHNNRQRKVVGQHTWVREMVPDTTDVCYTGLLIQMTSCEQASSPVQAVHGILIVLSKTCVSIRTTNVDTEPVDLIVLSSVCGSIQHFLSLSEGRDGRMQ